MLLSAMGGMLGMLDGLTILTLDSYLELPRQTDSEPAQC